MPERRFDCLCREAYTAFLYTSKVAWASIGDKDNIAGLSTGPMFLHDGWTIHIPDPWLNKVEPKPRRSKILLFELLMYGFGARGRHKLVGESRYQMNPRTWQVIEPDYGHEHTYI